MTATCRVLTSSASRQIADWYTVAAYSRAVYTDRQVGRTLRALRRGVLVYAGEGARVRWCGDDQARCHFSDLWPVTRNDPWAGTALGRFRPQSAPIDVASITSTHTSLRRASAQDWPKMAGDYGSWRPWSSNRRPVGSRVSISTSIQPSRSASSPARRARASISALSGGAHSLISQGGTPS